MDAIDASHQQVIEDETPPPSLLVVIIDTNPYAWAEIHHRLPLATAIANLLVFINAHLAFSHENRVAVIASHCRRAVWLYPTPPQSLKRTNPHRGATDAEGQHDQSEATTTFSNPNKYTPFATIESTVLTNLASLLDSTQPRDLQSTEDASTADRTTPIAGALTLALSYINRMTISLSSGHVSANNVASVAEGSTSQASSPLNSRILVVSTSSDLSSQYIPLMNAMFAAQHARVIIDVLKLAGDTVLLQQAAFTTGGVFLSAVTDDSDDQPNNVANDPIVILPALMHGFLPDASARRFLNSPTSGSVDFRAACFCHQRVVDLGYVCSICLSIFCTPDLPDEGGDSMAMQDSNRHGPKMVTCLTCGTRLAVGDNVEHLALLTDGEKKKKKKKNKHRDRESGAVDSGADTPA